MYEDLKYLVKDSTIPEEAKVVLSVMLKTVSWFPWVFIGVGMLLNNVFFIYWLGFCLFIFGAMIFVLLYMLVMILRVSLPTSADRKESGSNPTEGFSATAFKGIVGNFAFYLFIMVAFVVVKSMGLFDGLFQALLSKL